MKSHPSPRAPDPGPLAGFTIPFFTLALVLGALVVVVVLDLSLFWFGALLVIGIGLTIALDRFEGRAHPTPDETVAVPPPAMTSTLPDPDAPCPTCGEPLFRVLPGRTSAEDIRAFARSRAWSGNPEARAGWMPPGIFCPNGCVAVVATIAAPRAGNAAGG